jgi:hypothetical protein
MLLPFDLGRREKSRPQYDKPIHSQQRQPVQIRQKPQLNPQFDAGRSTIPLKHPHYGAMDNQPSQMPDIMQYRGIADSGAVNPRGLGYEELGGYQEQFNQGPVLSPPNFRQGHNPSGPAPEENDSLMKYKSAGPGTSKYAIL